MKIGVVGAGLMGAEIALVFAMAGLDVRLQDRNEEVIDAALRRLSGILDKAVSRGLCSAEQGVRTLQRLHATTAIETFSDRDMVIEAVPEDPGIKQSVLAGLDQLCLPECILASNTSTIPISTLAAALAHERRPSFLGTHFFSPVSRMDLVEVIPGFDTDPSVTQRVSGLLQQIGKLPVPVKDVAGFAVNRLLHALLIEAVKLVEEGVATPEAIDVACRAGLGHPVGPFALMDKVSSTLCLQVQEILHEAYGERFRPAPLLKQKVAAGYGGKGDAWIGSGRQAPDKNPDKSRGS